MKPEKDPLKAIFSTLRQNDDVIDWDREQKALYRFNRERIFQSVEYNGKPWFRFVDLETESSPDEKSQQKPNSNEMKPKSKDGPQRS